MAVLVTPALVAQAAPGCEQWNTQEFFRKASVADISECIDGGSDPMARGGYFHAHYHPDARFFWIPA